VPGCVIESVAFVFPFPQSKETPDVFDAATNSTLEFAQFNVAFPKIERSGIFTSELTVTVALFVQPFGAVSVTTKSPSFDTVGFGRVEVKPLALDQAYVTPAVLDVALSWTLEVVQSSVPPLACKLVKVVSSSIIAVLELVHPFGLVTVTVYTPATMTEGFCIFDTKPFGPDH